MTRLSVNRTVASLAEDELCSMLAEYTAVLDTPL
jgi:hypothetical protein